MGAMCAVAEIGDLRGRNVEEETANYEHKSAKTCSSPPSAASSTA